MPYKKRPVTPEVKPRGHRQHEPTDAMRKVVEAMAGFGMPKTEIARALTPPIQVSTLEKHYAEEIETGESRVKTRVAVMCLVHLEGRMEDREPVDKEGKVGKLKAPAIAANPTMAIFMAKAKLGLRDVQVIEQTVDNKYDYSKLSKDDLLQLRAILVKATATGGSTNPEGSGQSTTETKH